MKDYKKFVIGGLLTGYVAIAASSASADSDIKVRLDGNYINFDVSPVITEDRAMVSLRAVFEALGADVEWDEETSTINSSKEDVDVSLTIGNDNMYVNGKEIKIDAVPYIENDRTLVPLRAIAEAYNVNVEWRAEQNLISMASVNIGAVQNTVDNKIKAVSHRGYHVGIPENSLPAFRESRKHGYTYVEADIRFTKDNIPILTHEYLLENIAKNADGSSLEKSKNIGNMTYEQLCEYDFGIAVGEEYKGLKVTKFEDFIKLCDELNLYPYLDLKDNYNDERLNILIDIVDKYNMQDKVTWCKYFKNVLEKLPNAKVGYSCGALDYSFLDDIVNYKKDSVNITVLSQSDNNQFKDFLLNDFNKTGAPIFAWTVTSDDTAKAMCDTGQIAGIYTDSDSVKDIVSGY